MKDPHPVTFGEVWRYDYGTASATVLIIAPATQLSLYVVCVLKEDYGYPEPRSIYSTGTISIEDFTLDGWERAESR